MAYTAKTNWALDNIVLPADMNRIETGIKEAHDGVAAGGKFATPMKLSITGGATGEVTFDGTQNVALNIGVSATGHTHSNVTTSANGMMLSADKSKLDSIASGATRTPIVDALTSTVTTEALSAAQGKALKDLVDGKASIGHSHDLATSSSNGLMASTDKSKLDGIASGATRTMIHNTLTSSSTAQALSAGQGKALKDLVDGKASISHSHDLATTSSAGFMSETDKGKLDGIESGANYVPLSGAWGSASTTTALSLSGAKNLHDGLERYTGHSFDVIRGGWWINSTTYSESLTVADTTWRGRSVLYKSVQCPSSRSIGAGTYSTYDFSLGISSSLYMIADIHVVTSESTYVISSVGSLSISSQDWSVGITMYNPHNSTATARPIVGVTYVYGN